ncbi:phosphoribosylamine--glycine ligase [candidate division KSB1 bacterium]|nr:MAG: phosphoribosylamine--glycine ligase [candidate division KSB1 bacterium]
MKVLVIGGGGREDALVWKLAQSSLVNKIYCAPGNAGIARLAECVNVSSSDVLGLAQFAKKYGIDLTVVGPEIPLVEGIVDEFEKEGLKIFGPNKAAAKLEGSKVFAKEFMKKYGIPTAKYEVFENLNSARNYIWDQEPPIVVKADGLAAGKGSVVCRTLNEAQIALEEMMLKQIFGKAGRRVVIEEFLVGEEASVLAFTDGEMVLPMTPAQDHKAIYDDDLGPNTGGMGAYSPAPVVDSQTLQLVQEKILEPTVRGLAAEGRKYKGVLYAGLMITNEGPKVMEYNCRFGDPETQVILPLMESDLVEATLAVIEEQLASYRLQLKNQWAVCVVMASAGYPGPYERGKEIYGLDQDFGDGVIIFHAGTKKVDNKIVTNGGRVLGVTAVADQLKTAIEKSYQAVKKIKFEGAYYRKDIGKKGLARLQTQ